MEDFNLILPQDKIVKAILEVPKSFKIDGLWMWELKRKLSDT